MTTAKPPKRLGFFTRLLDQADAAERYRLAIAQIVHAERCGFDSAWVAQHHFHEDEGGLPAPFVFLAQVAAQTSRIRLGTGIVTLPLELPVRVAEDAAVLDLMCGGRLEVGVGPGGNLSAYEAFGLDSAERTALMDQHHRVLLDAWAGGRCPAATGCIRPIPAWWIASGRRPSRVDGRPARRRRRRRADAVAHPAAAGGSAPPSLPDIQNPMIDAYLEALPKGRAPRILASRTVFVADDRKEAMRLAEIGLARQRHGYAAIGRACLSRACRCTTRSPRIGRPYRHARTR